MKRIVLALSVVLAGAAVAAPEASKRPVARAGTDAPLSVTRIDNPSLARVLGAVQRPVSRPGTNARNPGAPVPALEQVVAASSLPRATSLRPSLRPRSVVQKAMARREARRKGQVCGDPDLQGDVVGYVPGRLSACGISEAVRLRSVSGVTLSQSALMDCKTAKALKRWTEAGAKPALRGNGGGLAGYRVAAHYACRTRNNQPGARVSEHGKGRAIDISGFSLRDGTQLTVLNDWNSRHRTALRSMHKAACGPFGTVLGPNSDRFHRDHFHFDTARYRNGPYCR
ncbi:extensin family protein [uncultured Tateyamaria sp.]|uniref:extensin-like domain-containing protein n=1 Tax=Tateyamaria sp. 1078 TaxID=3417464 RepID=UPI0026165C41|nr:extensin family protein [uncultured Tateyamaria sp.]